MGGLIQMPGFPLYEVSRPAMGKVPFVLHCIPRIQAFYKRARGEMCLVSKIWGTVLRVFSFFRTSAI